MTELHVRAFSPSDPLRIAARADFAEEHRLMGEPLFGPGRPEGPCWTLTAGDARWAPVLGCGGLEPRGQRRFAAWLYCADLTPRAWAVVRREFLRRVAEVKARRVEATVRCAGDGPTESFRRERRACAYARKAGLALEGRLTGFGPDGADYWLFAGCF